LSQGDKGCRILSFRLDRPVGGPEPGTLGGRHLGTHTDHDRCIDRKRVDGTEGEPLAIDCSGNRAPSDIIVFDLVRCRDANIDRLPVGRQQNSTDRCVLVDTLIEAGNEHRLNVEARRVGGKQRPNLDRACQELPRHRLGEQVPVGRSGAGRNLDLECGRLGETVKLGRVRFSVCRSTSKSRRSRG